MFQGQRMVLKGRVHIGLGGMPGVARFGEEAEVGQLKALDHRGLFRNIRRAPAARVRSVREGRGQEHGLEAKKGEEQ
jgi:hypothetical protein